MVSWTTLGLAGITALGLFTHYYVIGLVAALANIVVQIVDQVMKRRSPEVDLPLSYFDPRLVDELRALKSQTRWQNSATGVLLTAYPELSIPQALKVIMKL
jgi:hypothetical protein